MKIHKLRFIFENCEVIEVSGNCIAMCSFQGVSQTYHTSRSELYVHKCCDTAYIVLIDPDPVNLDADLRIDKAMDRLTHSDDITAICAYDSEEKELFDIYVPWEETEGSTFGAPNLCQKTKVVIEEGKLRVVFSFDRDKNFSEDVL